MHVTDINCFFIHNQICGLLSVHQLTACQPHSLRRERWGLSRTSTVVDDHVITLTSTPPNHQTPLSSPTQHPPTWGLCAYHNSNRFIDRSPQNTIVIKKETMAHRREHQSLPAFAHRSQTYTNSCEEYITNVLCGIQITLEVPKGANLSCFCFSFPLSDDGKDVVVFVLAFFWYLEASDANKKNSCMRNNTLYFWCPHRAHMLNCKSYKHGNMNEECIDGGKKTANMFRVSCEKRKG